MLSAVHDLKLYATVLFLIALGAPGIASAETFTVSGQVPCQGSVRLVSESRPIQIGKFPHSITLRPAGTYRHGLPVLLSLRTNCAYQISAEWLGATDTEARIGTPTVTAAAGMGHLTPQALRPMATATKLRARIPAVCVEGQAVSRGGNDTTSDNAILIELVLELPSEPPGDAVTFTLTLKD